MIKVMMIQTYWNNNWLIERYYNKIVLMDLKQQEKMLTATG